MYVYVVCMCDWQKRESILYSLGICKMLQHLSAAAWQHFMVHCCHAIMINSDPPHHHHHPAAYLERWRSITSPSSLDLYQEQVVKVALLCDSRPPRGAPALPPQAIRPGVTRHTDHCHNTPTPVLASLQSFACKHNLACPCTCLHVAMPCYFQLWLHNALRAGTCMMYWWHMHVAHVCAPTCWLP